MKRNQKSLKRLWRWDQKNPAQEFPLTQEAFAKVGRTTSKKYIFARVFQYVVPFIFIVVTFTCVVDASIVNFEPGGEMTVSFSPQPQIGQVTTLNFTFIPKEDVPYAHVGVGINTDGLEFLGSSLPLKGKDRAFSYDGFSLQKGGAFSFNVQIKVLRPGLWETSAGVTYHCKDGGLCEGKKFIHIYATEDIVTIYEDRIGPRKQACRVASYMEIVSPSDPSRMKHTSSGVALYLPKEHRLDFEPEYSFALKYLNYERNTRCKWDDPSTDVIPPKGNPKWSVEGGGGNVDGQGLLTAKNFGKGKLKVRHGLLQAELNYEVMPLPNPSPLDRIILTVVVPYDTPEEKAWVKQLFPLLKAKKVKSKEEAKEFLFLKTSKRVGFYGFEEENAWRETIMDGTTLLKGNKTPPKNAKVDMRIKKESAVNVSVHFYSFGVTASGEIVSDTTKEGPCVRDMSATSYVCKSLGFLGEGSYTFTEPSIYEMGTMIYVVK